MNSNQSVVNTGKTEIINCGLVLRSIGYKSIPVESGIPFDEKRGMIPNENGKIMGFPGLFCAGWLATGPRGVIVNTMTEASKAGKKRIEYWARKSKNFRHLYRAAMIEWAYIK